MGGGIFSTDDKFNTTYDVGSNNIKDWQSNLIWVEFKIPDYRYQRLNLDLPGPDLQARRVALFQMTRRDVSFLPEIKDRNQGSKSRFTTEEIKLFLLMGAQILWLCEQRSWVRNPVPILGRLIIFLFTCYLISTSTHATSEAQISLV